MKRQLILVWVAALATVAAGWTAVVLTSKAGLEMQRRDQQAFGLLKLQERVRYLPESPDAVPKTGDPKAAGFLEPGQWLAVARPDPATNALTLDVRLGEAREPLNREALINFLSTSRVLSGARAADDLGIANLWIGFARSGESYWVIGQEAPNPALLTARWSDPTTRIAALLASVAAISALAVCALILLRARKPKAQPAAPTPA